MSAPPASRADHAGRWSQLPGQLPGRLPIDRLLPDLAGIPLTLTEPPEGTVGQPYRWTASSKRPGSYTWHVWASQLPPGLSFADSTSGVLRGVPTNAGTYSFPVVVRSMHGARGESSATIVIKPAQRPSGAEPIPPPGQ